MRSSTNNTNFVAEFAAKRAAQLERARQLREERKKTDDGPPVNTHDRPPSGSPMTYARSHREEEVVESRPSSSPPYEERSERKTKLVSATEKPTTVPSEIMVSEEDFRRAVKQGVITPDQARQLWSVLSDSRSSSKLESFKKAQPPLTYDPQRYDTVNEEQLQRNTTKKSGRPEWNSDATPIDSSYSHEVPTKQHIPAPSRKIPGASYNVRQQPEWNSSAESEINELPQTVKSAPTRKVQGQVASQRSLPAWNTDFNDSSIPQDAPPSRPTATVKPKSLRQPPKANTEIPARAAANVRSLAPQAVPPADDDLDEVEAFRRMKEEQVRQFEEALQEADDGSALVPCNLCGRRFRETIIDRHEQACAKASKKRKTFDMTKARLEGIEGAEDVLRQKKRPGKSAPPPVEKPAGKMPKWKLQHQQFQAVLKMNKGGASALSGPNIPMPEELDDRVPCPHCGRKFATETAQRHIPKCSTTINKPKSLARPIRR